MDTQEAKDYLCPHCNEDKRIRNPTGYCDHLHYPENCDICKQYDRRIKQMGAKDIIEMMKPLPPPRKETDLDSLEIGTPSKGGFKIYYDSKNDLEAEVKERIDSAIGYINHAKTKMGLQ